MRKVHLPMLASLVALLLLSSCFVSADNSDINAQQELDGIASTLEADPQAAYQKLDALNLGELTDKQLLYYVLLLTKVLDHKGVNISSFEGKVLDAKRYFTEHTIPDKAALACFELARVYEAQGNEAKTLYFYQQADRWAAKASYVIPSLSYAKVPYNIAKKLHDYERYEEAVSYLCTALSHEQKSQVSRQYMLELKGICYRKLSKPDSAAYCYDLAKELARQNADSDGMRRLGYNSTILFVEMKDYSEAERRSNELLSQCMAANDSLYVGRLHMVLSRIAGDRGNIAQAVTHMQQAERYLSASADKNLMLEVFDMMAKAYDKAGNAGKASQYRQQSISLRTELRKKHTAELESLKAAVQAELKTEHQAELRKLEGENASHILQVKEIYRSFSRSKDWTITLLAAAIAVLALAAFTVVYRHGRGMYKELRVVCQEDLKADLARRELLNEMLAHVFESHEVDRIDKLELMDKVEEAGRHIPVVMRYRYKELHKRLKKEYPDFTHDELTVCWYIFTATIPEEDIPAALGLDVDSYSSLKQAMLAKMERAGKPFTEYYERIKVKNSNLS